MCAMHVTVQEFASLWGSSESPQLVFKQGIMYLLYLTINALLILTSCCYIVLMLSKSLNWNTQKQIRDNNIYLSYLVPKPSLPFQIVER